MDEKCKNCKYAIKANTWSGYKCRITLRPISNMNKLAWCNYFKPKTIKKQHNEWKEN